MPDFSYPQLSIEAVILLAAAALAVIFVNIIPSLNEPFDMLFTSIHELGHVLAVRLTGGEVKGYELAPRKVPGAKGVTYLNPRNPGNHFWVGQAGYLATSLASVGLILLTGWPYAARYALIFLGALLIIAVVNYGVRTSIITWIIGLGFGLGLILVGWQAALVWVVFLLFVLALQGVWSSFNDLRILAMVISSSWSNKRDDASQMEYLTGCASCLWVLAWIFISVLIIGGAFWFVWLRTLES